MSAIEKLIRFHKFDLDEKRRYLRELEEQEARIQEAIDAIDQEVQSEQAFSRGEANFAPYYGGYATRTKSRREERGSEAKEDGKRCWRWARGGWEKRIPRPFSLRGAKGGRGRRGKEGLAQRGGGGPVQKKNSHRSIKKRRGEKDGHSNFFFLSIPSNKKGETLNPPQKGPA